MSFMDEDFLLNTKTSQRLYHGFAEHMPIVDYHCHVSPKEIAEDISYENLTQAWLYGDHYKWRLMRADGADESEVTGNAPDKDKFMRYARTLPKAAGNPLYHWTHLELKRYFDCSLVLNPQNAQRIWEECNGKLSGELSVKKIIAKSNVEVICTTDDPVDDLKWHKETAADAGFKTRVYPAMRPDKALNIEKDGFQDYINSLGQAGGVSINTLEDLFSALENRMDYFDKAGCRLSDHALDYCFCRPDKKAAAFAFERALKGEKPSREEIQSYKTELLMFLARNYLSRGWVMQLHFGAMRNANSAMAKLLGSDTGYDCISAKDSSAGLVRLLDAIASDGGLPKLIVYSVNPNDNIMIDAAIGCFQDSSFPGKIQHGSAWWFNDTRTGILEHLKTSAAVGVLGNFIGMLTDSRSFLSYPRHEYFRRILCGYIGGLMEKGEYPCDMDAAGEMVKDISYNNAVNYFGF